MGGGGGFREISPSLGSQKLGNEIRYQKDERTKGVRLQQRDANDDEKWDERSFSGRGRGGGAHTVCFP